MTRRLMTVTIIAIEYDGTQRWDEFCNMSWNGKDKIWFTRQPFQINVILTVTSTTTQTQHTQLRYIHQQIIETFYHLISFIQNTVEEVGNIQRFKMEHIAIKLLSDHNVLNVQYPLVKRLWLRLCMYNTFYSLDEMVVFILIHAIIFYRYYSFY